MVLRELFATLGLDVDAQSFAKGQLAADAVKGALGLVVEAAAAVGSAFYDNIKAAGGWSGDIGKAATQTEEHFAKAADSATNLHEYLVARLEQLWTGALKYIVPVIQRVMAYVQANVKFYGDVLKRAYDWIKSTTNSIKSGWDRIKYVVLAAAAAIGVALVALKWQAVKAAAATAAAWLGAAAPFIAIGGLIAGVLLALDDIRAYASGGDSMFGRWKKAIDDFLAPKKTDPAWLKAIKAWLAGAEAWLTKKGAIDELFANVKAWFVRIGSAIWSVLQGPASAIGDFFSELWNQAKSIDWGAVFKTLKDDLAWLAAKLKQVDWKWVATQAAKIAAAWALYKSDELRRTVTWALLFYEAARAIGRAIDSIGHAIDYVSAKWRNFAQNSHAIQWLNAKLGTNIGGEEDKGAGAEQAPGSGVLLPETPPPLSFGAMAAAPWAPAPAAQVPYAAPAPNVTSAKQYTFQITQQPGEDGEALARRVVTMVNEQRQAELEGAAAAAPAVE